LKSFAVCHTLYAEASMVIVLLTCSTGAADQAYPDDITVNPNMIVLLIFMML